MLRFLPLAFLLLVAADWPQFRGPGRDGRSADKDLLQAWPKAGPKLLWSIDTLGVGYSAPSVVGDRIFLLGSAGGKTEKLFCLDAKDGKAKWDLDLGPLYKNPWGGGPRGNATVDGKHVFALSGSGHLVAVEAATGKQAWKVDLPGDLGTVQKKYAYPEWGFTESPLVDADHVYVTLGGPKGTMAALDRKTGKLVWRSKEWTDEIDYVSPVLHKVGDVPMVVQMTASNVAGLSPRDGSLLWKFPREARITVPSPLCVGDRVFVASGYGVGCDMIELKPAGGKFEAKSVLDDESKKAIQNHHGGVVLHEGHLYGHSDKGGWTCMEWKTGKVKWTSRKTPKGSAVYADGRLVLFDEEEGNVVLIEASPAGYKEHGRFALPGKSALPRPAKRPRHNFWTHPVVAGGRLWLRDQEKLMCFDIQAK